VRRADAPANCGPSIDIPFVHSAPPCPVHREKVKGRRQSKRANAAHNLIRGRFARARLPEVEAFTASLPFDRRLFRHDIRGSIAHAQMLAKVGLLRASEMRAIVGGLERIENEIARGRFKFDIADEDIHLAIERRLIALIGEPGRKLHT
jgi:argininosuccinate lyase